MGNRIQSLMKFKKKTQLVHEKSRRTLPVSSLWTPFSLWWSLKHRENLSFSQRNFINNMIFQKDIASAKSLNPFFSVIKSKTQRFFLFLHSFIKEIPEGNCQSSEPNFLCDEIKRKNIFFSQTSFIQNEIPEGHHQCQVSEPHYLCTDATEHIHFFF